MKEVNIYTNSECTYCNKLKDGLRDLNIPFTDIDVNLPENKDKWDTIGQIYKEGLVPVITIKPHLLVPRNSFNTIDEAIELIKTLIK